MLFQNHKTQNLDVHDVSMTYSQSVVPKINVEVVM